MKIIVNGKEEILDKETALLDFIQAKGLETNRIVIEYNLNILQKSEWSDITLKENDQLEVLRFVGGG